MAGFASLPLRVGLLAGLLLAVGATGAAAQEKVGVNSAVNPEAQRHRRPAGRRASS